MAGDFVEATSSGSAKAGGVDAHSIIAFLPLALDVNGAHPTSPFTDSLTLVATSIPGTATDCTGKITVEEIRQ